MASIVPTLSSLVIAGGLEVGTMLAIVLGNHFIYRSLPH
jgi:hypothetical protein